MTNPDPAAQVAAKKIQAEVDDALTGLIDILDAFDRFRRIGRLATAILADEARFQARLDRAEEESEGRRKTLLEVRAQQVDDWKRAEQAEAEVALVRARLRTIHLESERLDSADKVVRVREVLKRYVAPCPGNCQHAHCPVLRDIAVAVRLQQRGTNPTAGPDAEGTRNG